MDKTQGPEATGAYIDDPERFQRDLIVPTGDGPQRFGDCMVPFQAERFAALNPALLAVSRGERPPIARHWWEATKGASKDSDLAVGLLWTLAFTRRPLLAQVGAADAGQADELRKAAKDTLRLNPWLAGRVEVFTDRIICKATGANCEIIAADVAGSHGARPDVLIVNELSHITKREFAENLRDNSAKVTRGLTIVASNAGYVGTWQWKWREIARNSARWAFHKWAEPAPWIDPDEMEEARLRNSTSRFLRLWHGVWASGGDALSQDDINAAITLAGPADHSADGFAHVIGLDLGIKNDHAAMVVLAGGGPSHRIRLAQCQSWRPAAGGQVDLMAVEDSVRAAYRRFNAVAVLYDPYQAVLMAQRLARSGLTMEEMQFVGKNLDQMATSLLTTFRSRIIDIYREPDLIRDLGRLSIVEKSYGHKLESISDEMGHADRAIALAIALPRAMHLAKKDHTPIIWEMGPMGRSFDDWELPPPPGRCSD